MSDNNAIAVCSRIDSVKKVSWTEGKGGSACPGQDDTVFSKTWHGQSAHRPGVCPGPRFHLLLALQCLRPGRFQENLRQLCLARAKVTGGMFKNDLRENGLVGPAWVSIIVEKSQHRLQEFFVLDVSAAMLLPSSGWQIL